jgi:hypothetical protein
MEVAAMTNNAKTARSFILLACLLVAMMPSIVQAQAGQILFARGDVSIVSNDGQQNRADVGDPVYEGDHILTGERSMMQMRLSDGALVSLRSHSDYQIQVQKDKDVLEQAGELFRGWMRSVTGSIGKAKPEAVKQKTPVATIGIRGTAYQVIHIPDGGLPGYEDEEPGTYIFLEEGQLSAVAGGDTRYMRPGDVVFVPVGGGNPRPAQNKRKLFVGELGDEVERIEGDEDYFEGFEQEEEEDTDEQINDAIDDDADGNVQLEAVGARGLYNPSFPQGLESYGSEVDISEGESGPVVSRMEWADSDGLVHELQATEEEPASSGSSDLNGNAVIWGVWGQGDFTATYQGSPQSQTGDWHYVAASNVVDELQATSIPGSNLTNVVFDYVGGTVLTGTEGGSLAVTGGQLEVDFDDNSLIASISTANETYVGGDNFANFYDADQGVFLSGETNTGWGGRINGSFVGAEGDGAITNIQLDEGSTEQFYGTGAFERTGTITEPN